MSSHPTKLFVELCAGTAALSLAHFAKGAPLKSRKGAFKQVKPPVSRMGSKSGYAEAILDVLGLEPGEGQAAGTHYIWCEPDPGCRLLLEAYRDAALAKAAADIIRGWADEDPRALWERLRAEGPPRLPEASPGGLPFAYEVARGLIVSGWAAHGKDCRYYAGPDRGGPVGSHPEGWTASITSEGLARRADSLPAIPAVILPDARATDPWPSLPPGTVAYIDPPYVGTTQYANKLPRADVIALASRWADAGATVCISEAEPIPELVADGWEVADITGRRKGQRRTFSKQQSEFLTIKRATP